MKGPHLISTVQHCLACRWNSGSLIATFWTAHHHWRGCFLSYGSSVTYTYLLILVLILTHTCTYTYFLDRTHHNRCCCFLRVHTSTSTSTYLLTYLLYLLIHTYVLPYTYLYNSNLPDWSTAHHHSLAGVQGLI